MFEDGASGCDGLEMVRAFVGKVCRGVLQTGIRYVGRYLLISILKLKRGQVFPGRWMRGREREIE